MFASVASDDGEEPNRALDPVLERSQGPYVKSACGAVRPIIEYPEKAYNVVNVSIDEGTEGLMVE